MTDKSEEEQRLLSIFNTEAGGHLREISDRLQALAVSASPAEQKKILEAIYREAHSLKGAAQTVRWPAMESIGRAVSTAFYAVLRKSVMPPAEMLRAVKQGLALASRLLTEGREGPGNDSELVSLTAELQSMARDIMGQSAEP